MVILVYSLPIWFKATAVGVDMEKLHEFVGIVIRLVSLNKTGKVSTIKGHRNKIQVQGSVSSLKIIPNQLIYFLESNLYIPSRS